MTILKGLREITPYVPGKQPAGDHIIKLNTNENAFPPSPRVLKKLQSFSGEKLRRYSTLDQSKLVNELANHLSVKPDQIVVGNGSDDILSMAFLSFFNSQSPVLFPDLTYGFYKVWADLYHVPYQEIPLTEKFEIAVSDYNRECGGIIIANPNAPTGLYKSLDDIDLLLNQHPDVVVVVDEAYINFGGQSVIPLLDKYDNLFITRTFSKDASLAGLRVGYGIGSPRLIEVMKAVKNAINPYSVDLLAETLATEAVRDWSYYQKNCQTILETRDWFSKALADIDFDVIDSQTNFVLVAPKKKTAKEVYDFLEKEGIYVRYFPKVDRLNHYLRISIGRKDEMISVLDVIRSMTNE